MKGLFLKDFALMKNQLHSVWIIIPVAVLMMILNDDATFPVVYSIVLAGMIGMGSISYDAFDNGNAFLFTLPVTRKQYTMEKYLFVIASVTAGTALAFLFVIVDSIRKGNGILSSDECFFVLECVMGVLIFMAFLLPIELKFGPEKGRVAMVAIFAVIVACVFLLKELAGNMDFTPFLEILSQATPPMIFGVSVLLCVTALLVSYLISYKIMEKKEF